MDKAKLDRFIRYYHYDYAHTGTCISIIDHMYIKFGREFIHSLPVEYKDSGFPGHSTVVTGTWLWHSTTEPLYVYNKEPEFYILGYWLTLEQWLPYSALTSEEHTLFKLKYG